MALPPSKSPSSLPFPANSYSSKFHNPSRRSSEVTDPVRRSFSSGNPFTKPSSCPSPRGFGPPAPPPPPNTPKGYPTRRRDSISCPRGCAEKENISNLGSSKVHCRPRSLSPSTRTMLPPSASNISRKNFMSPTISTTSKISAASPRKKILMESNNNQPLHSSFTCSSDLRSSSSSVRSLFGTLADMEADHKDSLALSRQSISFSRDIEKENTRDLNFKVKLLPASRNTKHFMSPTISSASKINASPRNKILTESNGDQPPITSVTYSDSRSSCSSLNNISGDFATKSHDQKGPVSKKKVAFDSVVHIIQPVVSDPLQENGSVIGDELLQPSVADSESMESFETKSERENGQKDAYSDEVTCDSSFDTASRKESENVEGEGVVVNSVSPNQKSPSPVLAPLDTDQLIPELSYDPKTNYLAQRPKFLCYRLNPETTDYCEGELNHNPLDDGFIFDGFPDTEGTKEVDSEKLQSELENLDSKEKEMMNTNPEQEKEVVGGKESLGRHFLTSPKWIFLIFIIFIAFSAVIAINPQIRSYSMIQGSGFSMDFKYKAAGYLKGSVSLPGENLTRWRYDLFSYIFGFMSNAKGEYKWGYICFQNLTALEETWCLEKENVYHGLTSADPYMLTNIEKSEHHVQSGEDVDCEENSKIVTNGESEITNETGEESCDIEANVDQEIADEAYESGDASEGVSVEPKSEQGHEIVDGKSQVITVEEKFELDLAQMETMDEVVMDSMNEKIEIPCTGGEDEAVESTESPETDNMFSVTSHQSLGIDSSDVAVQTVMNISLMALSLVVTTTLLCGKRKPSINVTTSEEQDQEHPVEISDLEVSCSSAMSSYQKDSLDSKYSKEEATDEAQSHQSRSKESFRRESLTSSSSDLSISSLSPSYGSFATYWMIPIKHRNGDEEVVVTPVRRWSRLRK